MNRKDRRALDAQMKNDPDTIIFDWDKVQVLSEELCVVMADPLSDWNDAVEDSMTQSLAIIRTVTIVLGSFINRERPETDKATQKMLVGMFASSLADTYEYFRNPETEH